VTPLRQAIADALQAERDRIEQRATQGFAASFDHDEAVERRDLLDDMLAKLRQIERVCILEIGFEPRAGEIRL
jgi:uncharacterized protein YktB (UPF0637 family)